ncbi:MAG: hypothetical protein ACFFE5_14715 [Candidatus Thorarchaeota archaeon]
MENRIQLKIDEIRKKIQVNFTSYDLNKIYDLLNKLDENLVDCIKIDYKILDFFRNKKNFRIIQDLKDFGQKKLKYEVVGRRRVDIENALVRYVSSRNIQKEELLKLLGKTEIGEEKVQSRVISKKKVEDQTSKWMELTLNELKDELNDLNKYPDYKSLKKAANSILLPNERRLRKRQKIISVIINRISEDKAIAHLGR